MSVFEQIRELEEKKQQLLKQAKQEALDAAKRAVADLNTLGFNYQLVEGNAPATGGTRRSGVRQEVLAEIKKHPNGIARADLLEAMNVKGDKKGEQSVSNALSALKKNNTISQSDSGLYTVPA